MDRCPSLDEIPGSILQVDAGVCRVDWVRVDQALALIEKDELEEAYSGLAREWLNRLAIGFGGEYRVYESPRFLILSSRGARLASNLARVGARAFETMTSEYPNLAEKRGYGKFVCIVADSIDRYYEYLQHFSPPGEFGASGAVFIGEGYLHFVLNSLNPDEQEFALVHELTHAALFGVPLPLWLEEGLTQLMEETVLGGVGLHMNREEAERHRTYWADNGLEGFWFGSSFHRTDDGMELSYALSQVLVRNMISTGRERFFDFARLATDLDAGEASCLRVYGCSLSDWAAQFLGPGEWEVAVRTPSGLLARSQYHLAGGNSEAAVHDLEAALEQDPDDFGTLASLAWILSTAANEALRDGSRAVELAKRACEATEWEDGASLATLAAALAETGAFEEAVEWTERSIELSPGDVGFLASHCLECYRSKRPYRSEPSLLGARLPRVWA